MRTMNIHKMTPEEAELAVEWAALEGWNPGIHDATCLYASDPEGFLIGRIDDEPVAVISAVRYGKNFGFLGFYIVKPELRGQGLGMQIWNSALELLTGRNIGLDGVVEQQKNYQRSGFKYAHRNIRFEGRRSTAGVSGDREIVELTSLSLDSIEAYDRDKFPADRSKFLHQWIHQKGAIGRAVYTDGNLSGYGVARPCRVGYKIGPLFADTPEMADRLLNSLTAPMAENTQFYLDVPEINEHAVDLARRYDMRLVFETARMYTLSLPDLDMQRIFGITTFELG